MENTTSLLPFKISCLVFLTNKNGDHLLIKRNKSPNKNCWSPIGGKLDMNLGESPYECARRETLEEIKIDLKDDDLNCFGYISEKSYEGSGHWLAEGSFAFFSRSEIDKLEIPKTDKTLLWPYYDSHRGGFIGLRANCNPKNQLQLFEEISILE